VEGLYVKEPGAAIENVEAERQVLGALLTSDTAVERVLVEVNLKASDYYLEKHAAVHEAVDELHQEGKRADQVTAAEKLKRAGKLEQVGETYLEELAQSVEAPGNAKQHAEIVREKSRQRQTAQVGHQVVEAAKRGSLNGELELAARELLELAEGSSEPDHLVQARLYSLADLDELPPPQYLVRPFLREADLNVLIGKPGTAKSFFALALGLHIASGTPWSNGAKVTQGVVAYVAAEGLSGIRKRVAAWSKDTGTPEPEDFHVWPLPVNFFKGDTAEFEMALYGLERPPSLIVIDTLARCLAGGNENLAADVGVFVENLTRLCRRFNCAALVIHHSGKDGKDGRGSNSLEGASGVMVKLELEGTNLRIVSHRDKEAGPFRTYQCHLEKCGESAVIRPGTDLGQLQRQEAELLEAVSDAFGTDWATASQVLQVSGLAKSSHYRALKALTDAEYLEARDAGGNKKEYRVATDSSGVPTSPKSPNGTVQESPKVSIPLGMELGHVGSPENGTEEKEKGK
jgi:hypothetical protein